MTNPRCSLALAIAVGATLLAGAADAKPGRKPASQAPEIVAAPATVPVALPESEPRFARHSDESGLLLRHFEEIDTSGDGLLSREEIEAHHAAFLERIKAKLDAEFKAADTDGDGRIGLAEAEASLPRLHEHFAAVDADADGYVTRDELVALRRDHGYSSDRLQQHLKAADTDANGKLDLVEVQAALPKLAQKFAVLDSNTDGYLTLEELKAGLDGR